MSRRPTSIYHADVRGRANGGVRIHPPSELARAAGKNSYRIVFRDRDNKQRERSSTSLDGAIEIAQQLARQLARETSTPLVTAPTLGDLVDFYLEGGGRPAWRSESSESRNYYVLKRVLTEPAMATKASEIVGGDGYKMLDRIIEDAINERGLKRHRNEHQRTGDTLRRVFDVAAEHGLIEMPAGNPMLRVDYKKLSVVTNEDPRLRMIEFIEESRRPPTERVLEFVDAARDMFGENEALFVRVLAFGGLRPGEAIALTAGQIFERSTQIMVNRQVKEVTGRAREKSPGPTQRVRLPKWGIVRKAFVPGRVHRDLLDLSTRLIAQGRRDALLFHDREGGFRWQSNWRRDRFEPVAEHVNWPRLSEKRRDREEHPWVWSAYAFRHHYANHLLKNIGVSLPRLSMSMGHQNMRVTQKMYIHVEESDANEMNRQYDESVWGDRA